LLAQLGRDAPSEELDHLPRNVAGGVDYSTIPSELDGRLEVEDPEGALRPTIVNASHEWKKSESESRLVVSFLILIFRLGEQKSLLSPMAEAPLDVAGQKAEKDRCFDLLDALTRSGGLSMEGAMLHLVVASTHCFDKSLMDTLVQDNVNPIEKVEQSSLIVASVIHGVAKDELKLLA
jgi:hypothetical protein